VSDRCALGGVLWIEHNLQLAEPDTVPLILLAVVSF
jgi:hypothetical protein